MPLENLSIKRVCLHEIYCRDDDKRLVSPSYSEELLELSGRGEEIFKSRIISSYDSRAQCIEMAIQDKGKASILAHGVQLLHKDNADFINFSRFFADRLNQAQTSRKIPGGLIVVFDGTVGYPERPFFALMKAELQEGFLKTSKSQAEFVENLFLSKKTKLYKIGIFISKTEKVLSSTPDKWKAIVYDASLSRANREGVATYFYETFLELSLPMDAAQQVKKFFSLAKEFIKKSDIDEGYKYDLYNGLYGYLKLDKGSTIQVSQFADTYMGKEETLNLQFIDYMKANKFPTGAIPKDISELSLRKRSLRFTRGITLSGDPTAIRDLVSIEAGEDSSGKAVTKITVQGVIESQT